MARKTQIGKDIILQSALEMLIEKGYQEINIKTLSQKIGCSTQPIAWHFGNMDGLRKELAEYAVHYANQKIFSVIDRIEASPIWGDGYIDMAFDEPNLFRYLYMSNDNGFSIDSFDMFTRALENAAMIEQTAEHLNIPKEKVGVFLKNVLIYTHGLASYVASGLITTTKEEVHQMMRQGAEGFLLQIGAH